MEDPLHRAGARVEAAHVTGIRFTARQEGVLHDAADYDRVADDRQRLRMREARAVDGAAERAAQIDRAAVAEIGVERARARVQCDQQQVMSSDEDAGVGAGVALPVRDAAVVPADVGRTVQPLVGARIVGPDQRARAGVERRHLADGRADID